MLRYPFALLTFLASALPAAAQDCGQLCEAAFWMSASDADVQVQSAGLLAAGIDIDQAGLPLQLAISLGKPESTRALITAGADVNIAAQPSNMPPLSLVINGPNPTLAPIFLDAGAEVNATDSHGNTALHYAAASIKQPQTIALLIAAGAEVNALNLDGDTPLHLLAEFTRGSQETYLVIASFGILKNAGAELNMQNNAGQTALDIAASGANTTLAAQLISAGGHGSSVAPKE